jgi:hypothetical protein
VATASGEILDAAGREAVATTALGHQDFPATDLVLESIAGGGRAGRIITALASQAGLARLVEVQYVTKQPQSERRTLYVIS